MSGPRLFYVCNAYDNLTRLSQSGKIIIKIEVCVVFCSHIGRKGMQSMHSLFTRHVFVLQFFSNNAAGNLQPVMAVPHSHSIVEGGFDEMS